MDASRFDTATQRVSGLLTRRRGLGLLAALGVSLAWQGDEARARKRKTGNNRKKKQCKCAECSTCVKGKCRPVADRTACSDGACVNGTCEPTS